MAAEESKSITRPPATTPEARENQLISLAVDLAEKQMREGTASAQVISHFLKMGSTRERLEQERLARENLLLEAKTDAMASEKDMAKVYADALNAMRQYSGQQLPEVEHDYED